MTELLRYQLSQSNNSVLSTAACFQGKVGSVCAIGSFDGIHVGHQDIIKKLVAKAQTDNLLSALISFYPHPSRVLQQKENIRALTTLRHKLKILSELGLDLLFLVHFTHELRQLSPENFMSRVVIGQLRASHLILGEDTAFGKDRKGDAPFVQQYLSNKGITSEITDFVKIDNSKISSSSIRESILSGDFDSPSVSGLGRPYSIISKVIHGEKRGRTIGFPTANMNPFDSVLPTDGVYATSIVIEGKKYSAVTNIGMRPTFNGSKRMVETHVLDFDGVLYGKYLELIFVQPIRGEKKFESISDLTQQIGKDVQFRKELGS